MIKSPKASPHTGPRMPNDTDIQQQRHKAWQPTPTPRWVIVAFTIIGVIFIPIGAALLHASSTVNQERVRYDTECGSPFAGSTCTVSMPITHDMSPPIFVYYQLENYYQNHRRYVSSYSPYQLHGDDNPDTTDCGPTSSDNYWRFQYVHASGSDDIEATQYPCGATAGSVFNDTFAAALAPGGNTAQLVDLGGPTSAEDLRSWQKNTISYDTDKTERYHVNEPTLAQGRSGNQSGVILHSPYPDFGTPLPLVNDSDFQVWMRNAALPTFRKLYRIINCVPANANATNCQPGSGGDNGKLFAGDMLQFTINNNFDINRYNGSKYVVVSTVSWLGGKNYFLGGAWVFVGGLCFVLALLFALFTMIFPPKDIAKDPSIFQVPGGGQLVK